MPTETRHRPRLHARRTVVVLGIDGAGKTTTAAALVTAEQAAGRAAQLVRNPAGRRWLSRVAERCGIGVAPRWADRFESTVRLINVLTAQLRAAVFPGTTVMDRHLQCQQVLRAVRGLPRGRFLPWLVQILPRADAVVLLDLPAETAQARISARGEDSESTAYLRAAREAYLRMARSSGWHVVDAFGSRSEVLDRVLAAIAPPGK
ncbi:dTMP kinase [Arthrobacter sulfonylureivorans]|uniref:dTMP kinase n=1 Tax=Arthrobacter sulfonylureivorans TaxID=2486855 RepID=UPI0039E34F90